MAVKRNAMESYDAMLTKFKEINASMDSGAKEIQKAISRDLNEFVTGAEPRGKARIAWLRLKGHPYGRGRDMVPSTATGRKRGAGRKGTAPTLPIGQISGRLRKSQFVTLTEPYGKYVIKAGFSKRAKGALYAVLPSGTKKMVGRGLWAPVEKGALGKRVKEYRKAFRDTFQKRNRQP
jgi:hypothetical protein